MPVTWLDELKAAYPKRSGPMSWPRVFLKVRRALLETSWDDCIEGVKRYAKYCQEAGIEGSGFVVAPARFFEDEIYLEDLTFAPAEDPKIIDQRARSLTARIAVEERAREAGIVFDKRDSTESIQTRINLERDRPKHRSDSNRISGSVHDLSPATANRLSKSVQPGKSNDYGSIVESGQSSGPMPNIGARISELAARMRIAK